MTTFTVTCPCCKGETRLIMFDENLGGDFPVLCCHCQGDGRVPAEVDEHSGGLPPLFAWRWSSNMGEVVKPHAYVPDLSHYMGDCAVCGHIQSSPVHSYNEAMEREHGPDLTRER